MSIKLNLRLILLNIAITLALMLSINLLSNVVLFTSSQIFHIMGREKPIGLPESMKNGDINQKNIYTEFQDLKSRYEPFIGWSRLPFLGKTIHIDDHGDRQHINQVNQENLDKPVYFFGGSTVWGSGVTDSETLPAFFNAISGLPTFNQGESGFISRQSLAKFVNLIASGTKIHTVFFYEGINDVQTACRKEIKINQHIYTEKFRNILNEKNLTANQNNVFGQYLNTLFLQGTKNLGIQITQTFNSLLSESKTQTRPLICDQELGKAQKIAETLVNNWEIAHDIAVARGINFYAVLQPVAFIGNSKVENLEVYKLYRIAEQYQTVYPMIKKIIQQRGHDWILDYTGLFSQDESVYIDFAHVLARGNQIIAEHLNASLQKHLR